MLLQNKDGWDICVLKLLLQRHTYSNAEFKMPFKKPLETGKNNKSKTLQYIKFI